jgi:type IV secretion system protein VirD4
MGQLYDKYGSQAGTISGNCENWIIMHSREKFLIDEIIYLTGQRNKEAPLVSPMMLQTLNKDKGQAFVLYKRKYPFITSLPDIDTYPVISNSELPIPYPENTKRVQTVFDFEKFCKEKNGYFLSQLFSGRSLEEISNDRRGQAEYYIMDDGDNTEHLNFLNG